MRAKLDDRIIGALGVLAIALSVPFLSPSEGSAATASEICASLGATDSGADSDADGFTDFQECNDISFVGSSGGSFPGYNNRGQLERTGYLDPAGKDLFYLLVRAGNSLIPVSSPAGIYSAGLAVTLHEITSLNVDGNRFVTPNQKAVRVTESLDTTGMIFGSAWQGSPNDLDGATVYTQRIANFVNGKCSAALSCKDGTGAAVGAQNVIGLYIRNVIAHESGHVTKLTPVKSAKYEWHYAAGSGTVMEQSAKYTFNKQSKEAIFYLSTQYTPDDKAGVTLK